MVRLILHGALEQKQRRPFTCCFHGRGIGRYQIYRYVTRSHAGKWDHARHRCIQEGLDTVGFEVDLGQIHHTTSGYLSHERTHHQHNEARIRSSTYVDVERRKGGDTEQVVSYVFR